MLDELAASWKFENCVSRGRLNETIKLYSGITARDQRLQGKVIEKAKAVTVESAGVFELSRAEKLRIQAMSISSKQI